MPQGGGQPAGGDHRRHRAAEHGRPRGSPAQHFNTALKAEMPKIEKECATGAERALRRGDALPRRQVPPLQVPPLPGRAPGVRARVRHGRLRRRPGQLQLPPLRPRRGLHARLGGRQARRRRPTTCPWAKQGAKEGELVFVSGHPGGTERQSTVAELEFQRDVALPYTLLYLAELRGMLREFAQGAPEQQRITRAHAALAWRTASRRCKGRHAGAGGPEAASPRKAQGGGGAAREGGRPTRS